MQIVFILIDIRIIKVKAIRVKTIQITLYSYSEYFAQTEVSDNYFSSSVWIKVIKMLKLYENSSFKLSQNNWMIVRDKIFQFTFIKIWLLF